MKITKITGNNYTFYQEGNDYVLSLGSIKRGEDTTTEILFEEVESSENTKLSPKCGCTLVDKNIINDTSFSAKIKYTGNDSTFSKIIVINENTPLQFKIKIKGTTKN